METLPRLGDLARSLLALESDSAFINLAASQTRTNLFRILGTDERERWHSAFWAWMLDPTGSHGLKDLPLRRLLVRAFNEDSGVLRAQLLLPHFDDNDAVHWAVCPSEQLQHRALSLADLIALRVQNAIVAPGPLTAFGEVTSRAAQSKDGSRDDARFDVLVQFDARHPRHPEAGPLTVVIVVEVKVNAPYNPAQLERYTKWLHTAPAPNDLLPSLSNATFIARAQEMVENAVGGEGDQSPGIWCVGLFLSRQENRQLAPTSPDKLKVPWSAVTFADLIEDIIEPALHHPDLDRHARPLLQAYLDVSAHLSAKVLDMPPSEHRELVFQLLTRIAEKRIQGIDLRS